MEEYGGPSSLKIAPMTAHQKISETILVYPRRGGFEVIKDRVDIGRKTAARAYGRQSSSDEGQGTRDGL